MNLPQASRAGFELLTWGNMNLPQPAPNLPRGRSRPALTPAPPVRRAGGRGQVSRADKFTASTCNKCGVITLTGTTYGLRLNLEPRTLDDHTEYLALADGTRTYNLLPDLTAQRRHLEHIKRPERHPRHAEHVCGQQYGTQPRPVPPAPPVSPGDDPPF